MRNTRVSEEMCKYDARIKMAVVMVTGQLADATGDFACLVFVVLAASARPRVVQSARCPVRQLAIRELAYRRVVQLQL